MLILKTDIGIPFAKGPVQEGMLPKFRQRAKHVIDTISTLINAGGEIKITPQDKEDALPYAQGYKDANSLVINQKNAGILMQVENLLCAYDFQIIDQAIKTRNYILNRLILESEDDDAKIRLKALELLGKLTTVSAFDTTVKLDVTHRSIDQIDKELNSVLSRYMGDAQEVSSHAPTLPINL